MKVVRLSAIRTSRLYPPGNIPGTHFCWEHAVAHLVEALRYKAEHCLVKMGHDSMRSCAHLEHNLAEYLWGSKVL
jgi:hypothetical protein